MIKIQVNTIKEINIKVVSSVTNITLIVIKIQNDQNKSDQIYLIKMQMIKIKVIIIKVIKIRNDQNKSDQ